MQNQQKQINKLTRKSRHYHSQLPKGSYHSYCRRKIFQFQQGLISNSNQVRRNTKSFLTHRQKTTKLSAIDNAQNFQQYLSQFQRPVLTAPTPKPRNLTARAQKNKSSSKQNKKVQNEEIIDSHLPFFKCKLQKTQFMVRKPDFRVKETKFKVVKNIIQNNLLNYMGHSVQLSSY